MSNHNHRYDDICAVLKERYLRYLMTTFFFKDPRLRDSFKQELANNDSNLTKGPFDEPARDYILGSSMREYLKNNDEKKYEGLMPVFHALNDGNDKLYLHQQQAIEQLYSKNRNAVVATGTASGKTECFLYPIMMDLYEEHINDTLKEDGVRALILYPMNALANDQRDRLRTICSHLKKKPSGFKPTFGQYIGDTPEFKMPEDCECDYELYTRKQMREHPPHILLTNYSMLEYLLIRPKDCFLFDFPNGKHWKYIVLDEAHQYRGTKGMEIGMLLRRLKQRVVSGGGGKLKCVATSATLTSEKNEREKKKVAEFAHQLFDEPFDVNGVIFSESYDQNAGDLKFGRKHFFMRALEGAYLVHVNGEDKVKLNRKSIDKAVPIEIALCKECGQHYYVGKESGNAIVEADRDFGSDSFGVEFYMPINLEEYKNHTEDLYILDRVTADIRAYVKGDTIDGSLCLVLKCKNHEDHPDRIQSCASCDFRGSGDPVQEVLHGGDGPNSVVASTLHEKAKLNESSVDNRKVLAFADSRQDAAFFAWFLENRYTKIAIRNIIYNAISKTQESVNIEGLCSIILNWVREKGYFPEGCPKDEKLMEVRKMVFSELLSIDRRISLSGVGLVRWTVSLPQTFAVPEVLLKQPWGFSAEQADDFIAYLLDSMRTRLALRIKPDNLSWENFEMSEEIPQMRHFINCDPAGRTDVTKWYSDRLNSNIGSFLHRLCSTDQFAGITTAQQKEMMDILWGCLRKHDMEHGDYRILEGDTQFQLNSKLLRVTKVTDDMEEIYICDRCRTVMNYDIQGTCYRRGCEGSVSPVSINNKDYLAENHYRKLYSSSIPLKLVSQEHTAQLTSELAQERQKSFKEGKIHYLSTSTTFEVGVDLGDLNIVHLRNVPPEPFNYEQRTGRAGRRDTPGLAVTYCQRNPHDLYHYTDPEKNILEAVTSAPSLSIENEYIIARHVAAVIFSRFFRSYGHRYKSLKALYNGNIGGYSLRKAIADYCHDNIDLKSTVEYIVPEEVHAKMGLNKDEWHTMVTNDKSRLFLAELELQDDYRTLTKLENKHSANRNRLARYYNYLLELIENKKVINYLSSKAIIPKYGFPVDVVELDLKLSKSHNSKKDFGIELQRDLSQAIAEYAPQSIVIADKLEWQSYGLKQIPDLKLETWRYSYNDTAHEFKAEEESTAKGLPNKFIIPRHGFRIKYGYQPKKPSRRSRRQYTTRPFFLGFVKDGKLTTDDVATDEFKGLNITKATPAEMVILCEGRKKRKFFVCTTCGTGATEKLAQHNNYFNIKCDGEMKRYALGHKFVTNAVKISHPDGGVRHTDSMKYSFAYAMLYGLAKVLEVPINDLNVTVTKDQLPDSYAVVLYDDVPGGAGLVDKLADEEILESVLLSAQERVGDKCGCDTSCYGCLRSFRNQRLHNILNKNDAALMIEEILVSK